MRKNVVDLTEYKPKGGWIATTVPFIFNIDAVTDIQKKVFEFEEKQDITYVVRLVFQKGDHIDLVYPNTEARDIGYTQLTVLKAKSKFKVINGKSGN